VVVTIPTWLSQNAGIRMVLEFHLEFNIFQY
jgi:hypothetical protein